MKSRRVPPVDFSSKLTRSGRKARGKQRSDGFGLLENSDGKWGLLLPGAPEPRLTLLRRQDFRSVFQAALRGQSNRSIVVVGNYGFGPITAEPCRAKARPLRPRRSYFDPVIRNR